jgi:hypothetical protein
MTDNVKKLYIILNSYVNVIDRLSNYLYNSE